MSVELRFEVAGSVELSRVLEGLTGDMKNLAPAFERMAEDYRTTRHGLFSGEGSYEGFPSWAPLSPKYRAWKETRYPGRPTLVLTGETRASLVDKNHPDHFYEAKGQEMTLGSVHRTPGGKWNLALLHQTGTDRMPARPPGSLTQPEKNRWVSILHEWLYEDRAAWWIEREMRGLDRGFNERVND
jgi:hypothetical protein